MGAVIGTPPATGGSPPLPDSRSCFSFLYLCIFTLFSSLLWLLFPPVWDMFLALRGLGFCPSDLDPRSGDECFLVAKEAGHFQRLACLLFPFPILYLLTVSPCMFGDSEMFGPLAWTQVREL
ncbi:unnamed protein product [Linum trigynum]|uniref:Uncharacterized protein n=1 Tax=Linum trigynum TaxID=586398 RepID=A0AAV2FMX2_9ROSI